ncbi:hypothetical protein Ctob_011462, partial [Chrysochromulina tobinii]
VRSHARFLGPLPARSSGPLPARSSGPLPCTVLGSVPLAVLGSAPSAVLGSAPSIADYDVMQAVLGSAPSSADYDVMQAVLGSAPSVSAHALSRCIGPQPHWRALGIEVGTALNEGAARPPLGGCIIASPPISFRSVASSRARTGSTSGALTRGMRFRAAGGLGRRARLCFAQ